VSGDGNGAQRWRRVTRWSGSEGNGPIRSFLRTESGSSGVLVGSIAVALLWANVSPATYEKVWDTRFAVAIGGWDLGQPLRTWVNSGLMALFFLVAGLEARREVDLGDLRDRRRFVLPLLAGLVGLALPAAIYLLVNLHSGAAHGWGVAMSTDTALSLGLLAVIGRRVPDKVRVFLLTVFVVDDIVALVVIGVAYSDSVRPVPLLVALALYAALLGALRLGIDEPPLYVVLGVAIWLALNASGIDPVVTGLAIGLAATAYSPERSSLEHATTLFRQFREQPTAEIAREAATGLTAVLSPNARLQRVYHPWTSYVIVPLFGLANAGIGLSPGFLRQAVTSPVTLGVFAGYVVGKPIAVAGTSWLVARVTGGRIRPPVGWAAVLASGTIAGVGFTVSFLIAALAFDGPRLAEAKFGVLAAAVVAAALAFAVVTATRLVPEARRVRWLQGTAEQLTDLAVPVDPERDHVRGPERATVTIVEYGDFECPYCGLAEPAVNEELAFDADVRFVWRHLPLPDVHPEAPLAAEAAEAAAAQGAFWPMHDTLLAHQDELTPRELVAHAERLGLDTERFHRDLAEHVHAPRVAKDVESADLSNVAGTPTFFINGQRHYGAYDIDSLKAAVRAARDRVRAERGTR
jgi:Na+/H+ antiporter NhaA